MQENQVVSELLKECAERRRMRGLSPMRKWTGPIELVLQRYSDHTKNIRYQCGLREWFNFQELRPESSLGFAWPTKRFDSCQARGFAIRRLRVDRILPRRIPSAVRLRRRDRVPPRVSPG